MALSAIGAVVAEMRLLRVGGVEAMVLSGEGRLCPEDDGGVMLVVSLVDDGVTCNGVNSLVIALSLLYLFPVEIYIVSVLVYLTRFKKSVGGIVSHAVTA